MTTLQQQGREAFSEVLPLDGLSRFVRASAWAAMVSGLALIVSMVRAWLVVTYERLGQTEAYLTSSSTEEVRPQAHGASARRR